MQQGSPLDSVSPISVPQRLHKSHLSLTFPSDNRTSLGSGNQPSLVIPFSPRAERPQALTRKSGVQFTCTLTHTSDKERANLCGNERHGDSDINREVGQRTHGGVSV